MMMPGRKFSLGDYRYGFNGKENDNEVKSEGSQQDYGMRIYDPRVGKFLSVDPITKEYPELTPYQFASNRPIDGIDLDGLEYLNINKYKQSLWGLSKFETVTANYTLGHLEVRDQRIHSIVVNHPTNTHVFENGLEDPAAVNDMVTQRRSSSGKAQALSRLEAKTARREGMSDIVGGLVEATKWGVTTGYNLAYSEEMEYASASMSALNKADKLVKAAISNSTYPKNLMSPSVLTDLTNYITDLSIPKDGDTYYRQVITQWGSLIFNNEAAIGKGTFNFSPQKKIVKPNTLNGPSDLKINLGSIIEKTGNSDPDVNRANKLIEGKYPNRSTSVKSGK